MFDEKTQAIRRGGIGASETPCLFKECVKTRKYLTPIQLFQRKLGLVVETEEENLYAERGLALEPMVANRFMRKFKCNLIDPRDVFAETNGILVHPEYPWMMATLDRWEEGSYQPVQIKCLTWDQKDDFGEDGEEKVLIDYRIQCMKELGIMRDWLYSQGTRESVLPELSYLPVQFDDRSMTMVCPIIEWDKNLWNAIVAADSAFWLDHVMTGTPPPPDDTEAYTDYLIEQTDMNSVEVVEVSDEETNRWAAQYVQAKEVIKRANEIASVAKQKILVKMAGKPKLHGAFGRMTMVGGKEKPHTDWQGVAMAMNPTAEIVAQFTDIKTSAQYPRLTPDKKWLEALPYRSVQLLENPNE